MKQKQYEYRVITPLIETPPDAMPDEDAEALVEILNDEGVDGWEYVWHSKTNSGLRFIIILKRVALSVMAILCVLAALWWYL